MLIKFIGTSFKKGVHFKMSEKRTSYPSGMYQRNRLVILPKRRCATKDTSVSSATTLGLYLHRQASTQIWETHFKVVPGRFGNFRRYFRVFKYFTTPIVSLCIFHFFQSFLSVISFSHFFQSFLSGHP
jgi:hypothetical protein